jgi:hypothetical protein
MDLNLSAVLHTESDGWYGPETPVRVDVSIVAGSDPRTVGSSLLASIPVPESVRPSQAGHGDDSTFFESEHNRIVAETLTRWLRDKGLS